MYIIFGLILALLFFVFRTTARLSQRVTRRWPEDDQPWQYNASVIACWLCLLGFLACAVLAVVGHG